MVENVEKILHEEEYSDEEVIKVLGIDRDYLQQQILTPNTQNVTRYMMHSKGFFYWVQNFLFTFLSSGSNCTKELSMCTVRQIEFTGSRKYKQGQRSLIKHTQNQC